MIAETCIIGIVIIFCTLHLGNKLDYISDNLYGVKKHLEPKDCFVNQEIDLNLPEEITDEPFDLYQTRFDNEDEEITWDVISTPKEETNNG